MTLKLTVLSIFTAGLMAMPATAQTTGGVFGPGVSAGDRSAQARFAYAPSNDGRGDGFVARAHYQQSFSDALRGRVVVQGSDLQTGDFEYNFVQAELQWQFLETNENGLSSALRLDARLTDNDDGSDLIGVNSTTQWNINDRWQARGVILTAIQVGDNSRDGIFLETRANLTYGLDNGHRVGVESFNAYGNSKNFGSFNSQNHRIGPSLSGKIGGDVSYFAGALFGLSRPARDVDLRLWFGKSF